MQPWDDDFAAFVRAALHGVIRYVVKCGASIDEAADAVQEALVRAYVDWPTIENPEGWLRVVAVRHHLRARVRRIDELEKLREAGYTDDCTTTPEFCGDRTAEVLRQLHQLPMRQREVLALTADGFSAGEVAELLGISTGTVRSNLRHARQTLRDRLLPPTPHREVTDPMIGGDA